MSNLKVNKVNRNFQITVRLYHNSSSYNRTTDSTPRFYLKAIKINHIDKVGFTLEAENKGLTKYGHRFWRYEGAAVSDSEAESILTDIQNSYPYGYVDGDEATENKYILDVKENEAFQSFYSNYWNNNSDKIKQPKRNPDGSWIDPHPYIEYVINEIVAKKYTVGTVPDRPVGLAIWSDYPTGVEYYSEPQVIACDDPTIEVSASNVAFYARSLRQRSLRFQTGQRYRIDLMPTYVASNFQQLWPTGAASTYSGYRFRLSTGYNGTWDGYAEYTDGVSYITSPEVGYFDVKVMAKTSYLGGSDDTHPYRYSGSANGFALSGSGSGTSATGINVSGYGHDEGARLTLRRESTYKFLQYDSSNDTHGIYISTHPSGQNSNLYTSGVTHSYFGQTKALGSTYEPGLDGSLMTFKVPLDAPDTLYYACNNHAYMGGPIDIVDAPAAPKTGSVPGESIVLNLTGITGDSVMHYYSPDISGMGGRIYIKEDCSSDY